MLLGARPYLILLSDRLFWSLELHVSLQLLRLLTEMQNSLKCYEIQLCMGLMVLMRCYSHLWVVS